MSNVLVNEADLYLLAPLRIYNYQLFEENLIKAGWVRPSDVPFELYAQDALYESEAAFLGILKDGVSPLSKDGICFMAPEFPQNGTILSHFRSTFKNGNKLTFAGKKKRKNEYDSTWLDGLTVGNITRIHISPDKAIAMFLLHFRIPQKANTCQSIELVESTSYWLHKTDAQAPQICVEGHSVPGFETVLDIINNLLNSSKDVASLYHPGRLITATYVQVNMPEQVTESYMKDLKNCVAHIGQSKDQSYEISDADRDETFNLFDNIMVHASPEGFCGAFLVKKDQDNTRFMEKSSTIFLKSYLPVFIETQIVDLISVHMLDKKVPCKLLELSEQFRELKLMEYMPVSRYSHLLQLRKIISRALSISPKIDTVSGYLDVLREHNERRHEYIISFLLGFMGVGQVLYAALDLWRTAFETNRIVWKTVASIYSLFFIIFATIIIIRFSSYIKKR